MFHFAPPDILYFISSLSVTSCSSRRLTFGPFVSAGWRPAIGRGQRRVQPSESAAGRVRRPPAGPQPPLQGRPAEGVEWPGPSPSGHHGAAEGPNHIKPLPLPPPPDHLGKKKKKKLPEEKFPSEGQPCIVTSRGKTLIQKSVRVLEWEMKPPPTSSSSSSTLS